jgi:uncharacterized protein YlxW (UPF0749 family)
MSGNDVGEHDAPPEKPPEKSPEKAPGLMDLLRPRLTRAQFAGGLLCLLLGFAVVAQVESNKQDTTFASARQDELVGILSNLSQRSERLRGDLRELEDTKAQLERDGQGETALQDARERATAYGLLAGTLPAEGPGIELLVEDPAGKVRAVHLLDALQELRDAGAEVVQINDVRAGAGTYFVDTAGGVEVDGRPLRAPYRFLVIGDAHTMTTALDIPGGVIKVLENAGARAAVTARPKVEIRVTRPG